MDEPKQFLSFISFPRPMNANRIAGIEPPRGLRTGDLLY